MNITGYKKHIQSMKRTINSLDDHDGWKKNKLEKQIKDCRSQIVSIRVGREGRKK